MPVSTDRKLQVRLRQIRLEAETIVSFEFAGIDGAALPAFTAGAHIDLYLPGEKIRSYSLLNDPSEVHRYVIAVQKEQEGRGGSAWMHNSPRVGDSLTISAPVNDFPLSEAASASVFLVGGIGITPVLSMLSRLNRLGRPWALHYGSRSEDHAAFAARLRGVERQNGKVDFYFGEGGGGRMDVARIVKEAAADAHLYCCGPRRMIDDFLAACADRPPSHVHYERFAAGQQIATDGGFNVVLKRSLRSITVPAGKTILDALLDSGVSVPYACTAGVCGTCRTSVLEGEPEHRDDYLTDEEKLENRDIMICCSGSKSKTLVLDL
jgi:ferredoxin-NADP reductase